MLTLTDVVQKIETTRDAARNAARGPFKMMYFERDQLLIRRIGSQFGTDRVGFLEFLLKVLEHYSLETGDRRVPFFYAAACIAIQRLITANFIDNPAARAEYYLRAAQYCSARTSSRGCAEGFFSKAIRSCLQGADCLMEKTLEAFEAHNTKYGVVWVP